MNKVYSVIINCIASSPSVTVHILQDDNIKLVVQSAIAAEFDKLSESFEEREQVHQKEISGRNRNLVKTQVNKLLSTLGDGFNTDIVEACYRMGHRHNLGSRPSTGHEV